MLLDEPTSGLDGEATKAAEAEIKSHARNGSAVLFVSHDAEQAKRLADRQMVLSNGILNGTLNVALNSTVAEARP